MVISESCLLYYVASARKCQVPLHNRGAQNFDSSFLCLLQFGCLRAGLRAGSGTRLTYRSRRVSYRESCWENRGRSEKTRYAQAVRVCYDLSVLFLSLSEPLLGYYKPDVLGIVLESEIGPNRKKV